MNPLPLVKRRPVILLVLVAALAGVGALEAPAQMKDDIVGWLKSYFHKPDKHHAEKAEIVVTSPKAMDVTITQPFVCQIRSQQNIDICALDSGYLQEVYVKEGQAVKKGDAMFKILPILYSTKAAAEVAEARIAELEYEFAKELAEKKVVSQNEVLLKEAKWQKAKAQAEMMKAELGFTTISAPFDGIVDRQYKQLGSLIHESETLTNLSDNSVMWVYFNVPEKQYLAYVASSKQPQENQKIELELANQETFPQPCLNTTVEGKFNNQTGNIAFRADFPNPDGVLRHGQTGTILIHRTLKDALVIPQRATFELLDKQYVWVVGADDVAHQRLITIKHELEDTYVINTGLHVSDKIVFEGVRDVQENGKVEYEFKKPEEILQNQKFHAE